MRFGKARGIARRGDIAAILLAPSAQFAIAASVEQQRFAVGPFVHVANPPKDYQVVAGLVGRMQLTFQAHKRVANDRCPTTTLAKMCGVKFMLPLAGVL